ncbi:cyclic lactone autoinducer peptide [Desulforamulus aeronauticus]|nr:cyclic lactone autoinducer peptide [Desulforamulus aeronauticus]
MIYLLSTVLFFVAHVSINITCLLGSYEPKVPDCLR